MAQQRGLGKSFNELLAGMPPERRASSERHSELDDVHLRLDEITDQLVKVRDVIEKVLAAVDRPAPPNPLSATPLVLLAESAAAAVDALGKMMAFPLAVVRLAGEHARAATPPTDSEPFGADGEDDST
jgi:hypothetical protein